MKKSLLSILTGSTFVAMMCLPSPTSSFVSEEGKKGKSANPMELMAQSEFAQLYIELNDGLKNPDLGWVKSKSSEIWNKSQQNYRLERRKKIRQQENEDAIKKCYLTNSLDLSGIEFNVGEVVGELIQQNECNDLLLSWIDLESEEASYAVKSRMFGIVGLTYDISQINIENTILFDKEFEDCLMDEECREKQVENKDGLFNPIYLMIGNNLETKDDLKFQLYELHNSLKDVCGDTLRLPQNSISPNTYWNCEFHRLNYSIMSSLFDE